MATYNKDFKKEGSLHIERKKLSTNRIAGDTRIIDLTVEQLADIITDVVNRTLEAKNQPQQEEWAYGMHGLADTLGCSVAQATKIKASGKYNSAIKQVGRKIIVNVTQLRKMLPNS